MYPKEQKRVINYIYNGPYTVVSTTPNGYSMTVRGIKINDDEQQKETIHWRDDYSRQEALKI